MKATIAAAWFSLACILASVSSAVAQEAATPPAAPTDDDWRTRIERELAEERAARQKVERELDIVKRKQFEAEEGRAEGSAGPEPGEEGPIKGSIPERATENLKRPGARGGVFAKPFLARWARGAYLGGYMDFEYRDQQGEDRTFRAFRFIPFIYADVTENIKVAAEIEFEFGGPNLAQKDGEIKIEFAFVDYVFSEALALRAGSILMPVGKFNLIHDSPVNDLVDRPLVDRNVIPTTWNEAGIGLYGSLYPFGEAKIDYEAYVVNGFQGLTKSGTTFTSKISEAGGLRNARGSMKLDNNNSLAGVGRLAFSPFLGVEVGASAHAGRYDSDIESSDWLVLWAIDGTIQLGRFADALQGLEIQGEFARADINRGKVAVAAGVPSDLWGYYAQANYHFMFDALKDALPVLFKAESTFTAVARLDFVKDERPGAADTRIVTAGLNFRPVEDTVFKFDYQFNFEGWRHTRDRDDAFLFGIATYF